MVGGTVVVGAAVVVGGVVVVVVGAAVVGGVGVVVGGVAVGGEVVGVGATVVGATVVVVAAVVVGAGLTVVVGAAVVGTGFTVVVGATDVVVVLCGLVVVVVTSSTVVWLAGSVVGAAVEPGDGASEATEIVGGAGSEAGGVVVAWPRVDRAVVTGVRAAEVDGSITEVEVSAGATVVTMTVVAVSVVLAASSLTTGTIGDAVVAVTGRLKSTADVSCLNAENAHSTIAKRHAPTVIPCFIRRAIRPPGARLLPAGRPTPICAVYATRAISPKFLAAPTGFEPVPPP
ncbi:MAG: hypothetical protein JWN99_237 [Ilumatobacteraceae bacterium]|nr:hypothetical protein [Ilumatobacteraceae bacterium]